MKFVDINNKDHSFQLNTKFGVKRKENARSLSQWKVGKLVCKIYGRNNVFEDYPLPGCGNLSWDFWVPNSNVAFEFHGEQHDTFIKHFHTTKAGFHRQKINDNKKGAIATKNDVTLIVIRKNDFKDWSVDELKDIITMELD